MNQLNFDKFQIQGRLDYSWAIETYQKAVSRSCAIALIENWGLEVLIELLQEMIDNPEKYSDNDAFDYALYTYDSFLLECSLWIIRKYFPILERIEELIKKARIAVYGTEIEIVE